MKVSSSSILLSVHLALCVLIQVVLSTASSYELDAPLSNPTVSGPSIALSFVTPSHYSRSRITKLRRISRTRIVINQSTEYPVTADHLRGNNENQTPRRKIIRRNRTVISTTTSTPTTTMTTTGPYHISAPHDSNMKNYLIVSTPAPSTTRIFDLNQFKTRDTNNVQQFHNRSSHHSNHNGNHHHHNPQHQHTHWNSTSHKQSHKISNEHLNVNLEGDYMNYLSNGSLTPTESGGDKDVDEDSKRYWAFMLFIFPFFTIFGNLLVVISVVKEKNLHTLTNYFIVSLAISDLTVAAGVMPLAVYYEFSQKWIFSPKLCDAWVALDVMASTASILNLVSIAVDRFIAVTQPLKYARHKNSKRIYFMIAFVWLISVSVASPIVIGFNNSPERRPDQCSFFNNQFLIYSSMFSFYIPTIAMIFLYYKIFQVIRSRAKSAAKKYAPKDGAKKGKAAADTARLSTTSALQNTTVDAAPSTATSRPGNDSGKPSLISVGIFNLKNRTSGLDTETDAHLLTNFNEKNDEFANNQTQPQSPCATGAANGENDATKKPLLPSNKGKQADKSSSPQRNAKNIKPSPLGVLRSQSSAISAASSNKERKVTKMLAIVLICFLVCWSPFFTINNLIKPICEESKRNCDFIKADYISFLSWLGYLNSLLNPIIYTIFNVEFRIAFKKILKEICCKK